MSAAELRALWRTVAKAIPSRHLHGELLLEPFGVRLELARIVAATNGDGRLRYLEIGVRLGHSLAYVAAVARACGLELAAAGVDAWGAGYGDEQNPGEAYVLERLEELGVAAGVELVTANSHAYLEELEARSYDLIFVDGDHTSAGARKDLEDAYELLELGGVLVMDDTITEAGDDRLLGVWRAFVATIEPAELESITEVLDVGAGVPAYALLRRRPAP